MTYIEFFDTVAAENICASLANVPERVILIGGKLKLLQDHAQRYKSVLQNRGHSVEFVCRTVNKNNMQSIVELLSNIVETYDNCVFDLTGGEDLYLVAVGIVSERFKDRNIQMHRFNIKNNTIIDCDRDGNTIMENALPHMTIEENISIYGGTVIREEVRPGSTYSWKLDADFAADIRAMWEVCRRDVRLWNAQIGVLEVAEHFRSDSDDPMTTAAPVAYIRGRLKNQNGKFLFNRAIIGGLYDSGLIRAYEYDENLLKITYKNEQVKRCLTKAGLALEMKMFLAAKEVCDTDGTPVYNDVMNGVCIDWDGEVHASADGHDTENEIDVIMMHGLVPVFVSCKNGFVEIDELYKLNSVSNRFGQRYAKKVLVATALGKSDFAMHFRERAKDMNIRLVEEVQFMSDEELERCVRSLWCN